MLKISLLQAPSTLDRSGNDVGQETTNHGTGCVATAGQRWRAVTRPHNDAFASAGGRGSETRRWVLCGQCGDVRGELWTGGRVPSRRFAPGAERQALPARKSIRQELPRRSGDTRFDLLAH